MTAARTGHGATITIDAGGGATAIAGIIDIVGPELAVEQVDGTSLDSIDGYTESVPALKTGGTVTITAQFTNDISQQAIRNIIGAVTPAAFVITLPTSPLAVISFSGVISSWVQSTEPDALMPVDIDITISGEPIFSQTPIAPPPGYPAWWPTPQPLPQIRATGAAWMGMDGGTDGLQASVAVTVNAALPYSASGITTDHAAWQFSFNSASPDNRIDLPRNSYIEYARLTLSALFVGPSFAGARIYLKKRDMTVSQATGNGITAWQAAGKLTTAYVAMTTANTAVGENTYDVTALINEAIEGAASEWQDSNQILQFCVIPNASSTEHAETGVDNLILDRNNPTLPGAEIDRWTTRLNVSAIVNTGSYETALTQDSVVFSFTPVTLADTAVSDSMRTVALTDTVGGRGNFYLDSTSYPSLLTTHDITFDAANLALSVTGTSIVELPPENWVPDGYAPAVFFGTAYYNDPTVFTSTGALYSYPVNMATNSYMYLYSGKWEAGMAVGAVWDYTRYPTLTTNQFGCFLRGSPDAQSVYISLCGRSGVGTVDQVQNFATAPAAGRNYQSAVLWDHASLRWRWWFHITDAAGAVLEEITGNGPVWSAGPIAANNYYKAVVGFGFSPRGMYGQMWQDWQIPVTDIWQDIAIRQTQLWMRGIKSIDPRIMVP